MRLIVPSNSATSTRPSRLTRLAKASQGWTNGLGVGLFAMTLVLSAGLHGTAYAQAKAADAPQTTIQVGSHTLNVEVAANDALRMKGLMFRTDMPQNHGMLFVYQQATTHCMWMRNTLIPLDVAFIDDKGSIINIATMSPMSDDSHCAAQPARYALEVNKGWFAAKGIKAGAKLSKLPAAN